jgi:hypothetical protein
MLLYCKIFTAIWSVCVCVCVLTYAIFALVFLCPMVPAQRIDVFYHYLPVSCLMCVYSCTFYCIVCLLGLAGHVVLSVLCGAYNHTAAYKNQAIDETSQHGLICNYSYHTLNDGPHHAWIWAITFAGDSKWRKRKRRKAFVIDTTTALIKAFALYNHARQHKSRKCEIFRIKHKTYKIEIVSVNCWIRMSDYAIN